MKKLLQETIGKGDSWRIAVVCVMLNKITAERAEPVIKELIKRWPTKEDMAKANLIELIKLIKPLGLEKVRANALIRLSNDLANEIPREKIYGLGQYGQDSLSIFVDKNLNITPKDPVLMEYVKNMKKLRR
jgi:methyl-CpG-binding domain protein 4